MLGRQRVEIPGATMSDVPGGSSWPELAFSRCLLSVESKVWDHALSITETHG